VIAGLLCAAVAGNAAATAEQAMNAVLRRVVG